MTVKICLCVCGRVSVQEAGEEPCCPHCGEVGDNIEWVNVESITFRQDLELMRETLDSLEPGKTVTETENDIQFHDASFVGPDAGGEPLKEPEKEDA